MRIIERLAKTQTWQKPKKTWLIQLGMQGGIECGRIDKQEVGNTPSKRMAMRAFVVGVFRINGIDWNEKCASGPKIVRYSPLPPSSMMHHHRRLHELHFAHAQIAMDAHTLIRIPTKWCRKLHSNCEESSKHDRSHALMRLDIRTHAGASHLLSISRILRCNRFHTITCSTQADCNGHNARKIFLGYQRS